MSSNYMFVERAARSKTLVANAADTVVSVRAFMTIQLRFLTERRVAKRAVERLHSCKQTTRFVIGCPVAFQQPMNAKEAKQNQGCQGIKPSVRL